MIRLRLLCGARPKGNWVVGIYLVVGFAAGETVFPTNLMLLKGCQVSAFLLKVSTEEPKANAENLIEIGQPLLLEK